MLQSDRTLHPFVAIAFLCFTAANSPLAAADTLRTVALTGKSVSAADPTIITGLLARTTPLLNNNGLTAFEATIQAGSNPVLAILTEGGGAGLRVAVSGATRVDGLAVPYSPQAFNDDGQTVYSHTTPSTLVAAMNIALVRDNGPGDSSVVARSEFPFEEALPGFTQFYNFSTPPWANAVSMFDQGRIVFPARATDTGNFNDVYAGIWRENTTGGFDRVVRNGDPAPGTPDAFQSLRPLGDPPVVTANSAGRVAFIAMTSGSVPSLGVWSEQTSGLQLEALAGHPAPGIDGATFSTFASMPGLAFNSQGHIAFAAGVRGTSINGSNNAGIWRNRGDDRELVVQLGDQAIGATPGQTYVDFRAQVLNARGQMAFVANTRGPDGINKFGLWSNGGGDEFKLLAYPGIPAPDVEPGVVFDALPLSFPNPPNLLPLVLNANGQVAFISSIIGPGIENSNNNGIWAQDRAGILRLIAREGDQINVSDDPLQPDWRTIRILQTGSTSGNDDGRRSWFNDRGQLAFLANFTDGSQGIFVSDLATIPEPHSLALLLIALAFTTSRVAPPLAV